MITMAKAYIYLKKKLFMHKINFNFWKLAIIETINTSISNIVN